MQKITDAIWLVCSRWFGSVVWEHTFMVAMGFALLGASGKWSVALGVALPIYWMHEKNKRIRQLERVVKINSDFWEKADSTDDGEDFIRSMREVCKAVLPNTQGEPCPQKT